MAQRTSTTRMKFFHMKEIPIRTATALGLIHRQFSCLAKQVDRQLLRLFRVLTNLIRYSLLSGDQFQS